MSQAWTAQRATAGAGRAVARVAIIPHEYRPASRRITRILRQDRSGEQQQENDAAHRHLPWQTTSIKAGSPFFTRSIARLKATLRSFGSVTGPWP